MEKDAAVQIDAEQALKLAKVIIATVITEGGATVQPETAELYFGRREDGLSQDVFAVGGIVDEWTLEDWRYYYVSDLERNIAQWITEHVEEFARGFYIGAWVEGSNLVLDVTQIVKSLNGAVSYAKSRQQRAIYHFGSETTLWLDGGAQ